MVDKQPHGRGESFRGRAKPRVLEQRERRKGTESYLIQKSRPLTMEAAAAAAI